MLELLYAFVVILGSAIFGWTIGLALAKWAYGSGVDLSKLPPVERLQQCSCCEKLFMSVEVTNTCQNCSNSNKKEN